MEVFEEMQQKNSHICFLRMTGSMCRRTIPCICYINAADDAQCIMGSQHTDSWALDLGLRFSMVTLCIEPHLCLSSHYNVPAYISVVFMDSVNIYIRDKLKWEVWFSV